MTTGIDQSMVRSIRKQAEGLRAEGADRVTRQTVSSIICSEYEGAD